MVRELDVRDYTLVRDLTSVSIVTKTSLGWHTCRDMLEMYTVVKLKVIHLPGVSNVSIAVRCYYLTEIESDMREHIQVRGHTCVSIVIKPSHK